MVHLEQHVVLPADTEDRGEKLLRILGAFQYKLSDLYGPINKAVASKALEISIVS